MDEMKVALAAEDEDRIFEVLDKIPNVPHLAQMLASEGICLLSELCKRGLVELMDAVLSSGVDVHEANNQDNLISTAVSYNQVACLDYLLTQHPDLQLLTNGVKAWHEVSPFHIASKRGQSDILRKLYAHDPGLVKQDDVRASLLYASCQGGSVECFELWISPSINMNNSITLVQSERDFGNFERNTPLYAVCNGGHRLLLLYMMENFPSLELHQTVCNEYPDMIGEFVAELFVPVDTSSSKTHREGERDRDQDDDLVFQMCVGNLQHKNMHVLHTSWLVPYTVTLQQLNLTGNKLTDIPKCLPWDFQNLQNLNISNNNLKYFTGPKQGIDNQPLCPSLTDINLSNNKLEMVSVEIFCIPSLTSLDLSHNKLSFLVKSIHQDVELQQDSASALKRKSVAFVGRSWDCKSLKRLDVSHNTLQMFPSDIMQCKSLKQLSANNNNLTTFPQPWECPLEHLDLSENQLERFPVDTEKYWCSSLAYLNISNNRLSEINEGIVKLSVLTDLNASSNRIERLPAPDIWECGHLHMLNLKNNRLGQPIDKSPSKIRGFSLMSLQSKNRLSLSTEDNNSVSFPDLLATCLRELRLANNNLDCVPASVCNLKMLEILDLSENPLIRTLPIEMGKLRNCGMLKLKGLNIDNIKETSTEGGAHNVTKNILSSFMDKLRDCREYNNLKTIVLGKKDKGKTTLVNILANKKNNFAHDNRSITREEVITKRKTSFSLMPGEKKTCDVKLSVWDIAGDEAYTLIHHSMFTRHTLYLLVWDFWSIETDIDEIGKWLHNIQAASQYYSVILIGTFLDKRSVKDDEVRQKEDTLRQTIDRKFNLSHTPNVCAVSCVNKRGIEDLKLKINATAHSMKLPGRRVQTLIPRKVPKSYFDLEKAVSEKTDELTANKKPPVMTQAEFTELLEEVKDEHLSSTEETANVTRFLAETGSLLHFSDQIGALNTLYFLDPAWFCDVLVHILINPDGKRKLREGKGKISRNDAVNIYKNDKRFPDEFIDQYIEMLERFEIAVNVDNSQKLFFPCQLPENPPLYVPYDKSGQYKKICRFYRMAECPSGFWTRLLTRMMTRVEHFSTSQWYFQPLLSQSVRKMTIRNPSFKDLRNSNTYHGLHLRNATKTFCREWMLVQHEEGAFCVEPVEGGGDEEGIEDDLQKGILITEIDKTEKFGAIGIIVDEIEDIIHDFYPGLLEPDEQTMQLRMKRYALCSTCYGNNPTIQDVNHFTMEHCARMLVESDYITCPKGHQHKLETLVPDLLMKELPDRFILDRTLLQVVENQDSTLGGGVAGSVFRGTYGNKEIAVKIYRSDIRNKPRDLLTSGSYNSTSTDSGTATISTQGSIGPYGEPEGGEKIYANVQELHFNIDLDEAESIKAFKALKEMRQEVALTSRLHHPCIISLVGILFSPKLMLALELAPLGSLRDILNKQLEGRPVFRKYLDKEKDYPTIFTKELSFKFVFQIAKGLDYLHSHGIIYKDLKSDNILAMSLDTDVPVNLKLSDYGISKYSWGGRSVGLVGTPGYQAPEILDGLPYDEKVDIFSLSMVIYEILTGNRPYMEYDNVGQISKAIKTDDKRPSIKEFRVLTHFPHMEDLMVQCWQKLGSDRPKAASIVKKTCMKNAQFITQRSSTTFDASESLTFAKDAVIGASDERGPPTLWIWEGDGAERCYSAIDIEKSSYRYKKCPFPGPKVVCMSKVDKQIWIGTEMNTIEVCGAETGNLDKSQTITLNSLPLHMLSYVDKTSINKETTVYVAQSDGNLLKYMRQTIHRQALKRPTLKSVDGFSNPKMCTLRSANIHCMTLANQNTQLWISHSSYVDVVGCAEFKVISDSRINVGILNSICGIPQTLNICDMVSNSMSVFCLLESSPIVLEFDIQGNCNHVIEMAKRAVVKEIVSRRLELTQFDHEAYHGNITSTGRNSTTSTSSNDSVEEELDNNHDVTNRFENSFNFWATHTNQSAAPPLPPKPSKTGQQDTVSSSSEAYNTYMNLSPSSSPSLRQRSLQKPNIPERIPKVPPRTKAMINQSSPLIPPRLPKEKITESNSTQEHGDGSGPNPSVSDLTSSGPPAVPKRLIPSQRPMTLCVDRNEKIPLQKQSSQSLPSFYKPDRERMDNDSMYDFHLTSIQIVEDSLWVARSYGDVCVVDLSSDNAVGTYGQVVASMKDLKDRQRECMVKEPKLVCVDGYMATAYNIDTDMSECFEIASWDCHRANYFRKCDKFWTDLIKREKDLANAECERNNVSSTNSEEF